MREPGEGHRVIASLGRLWPLLGRCIAFHKRLVDLTGSVKASLMLSQAIYWTRRGKDMRQRDGWFFKTIEQWQHETGLSRHEQAGARAVLRGLDLLQERRCGLPARSFFRVDGLRLAALLAGPDARRVRPVDWDDNEQICELLGPALSFHRSLSAVTGNVNAALFLSRAVYFTRINSRLQSNGGFSKSSAQWQHETGLTRREQAGAREVLRDLGIVEETLAGVPPQLLLRINVGRLIELLSRSLNSEQRGVLDSPEGGEPECGNATYRYCANRQTRMWESHNLILRKPADKTAENRNNSQPVSAKLYVQKLITRSVSTKPPLPALSAEANERVPQARGGDLIFPNALLPEERLAAEVLVMRCPQLAQAMLDELAGRMNINAIRLSPIGYLRGILKRAQAGDFVQEMGVRVAAARCQREEAAALRQKEDEERLRRDAERANPEYQARIAKRQVEIRNMLDAMAAPGKRRRTP